MVAKEIVPALGLESFSCPHVNCGAIAHQTWFKLYVDKHHDESKPWLPRDDDLRNTEHDMPPDAIAFFKRLARREVFLENNHHPRYLNTELMNVHASKCYSCGGVSLWRADELIYPVNHISIAPNEGMPTDVKTDYMETNEILDKSPRGAAALLRLSVQKLMIHLGEKGKNINDDIASLVRRGLDASGWNLTLGALF